MNQLTLQKLLASILAEECIMRNWRSEVVNHKLKHRLDLLLSVAGIMCQSRVL